MRPENADDLDRLNGSFSLPLSSCDFDLVVFAEEDLEEVRLIISIVRNDEGGGEVDQRGRACTG